MALAIEHFDQMTELWLLLRTGRADNAPMGVALVGVPKGLVKRWVGAAALVGLISTGCSAVEESGAESPDAPPVDALVYAEEPAGMLPVVGDAASFSSFVTAPDDEEPTVTLSSDPATGDDRADDGAVEPAPLVVPGLPRSIPIEDVNVALVLPTLESVDVYAAPFDSAPVGWTLPRIDEFGQPRVFRVTSVDGSYLRVQVPARPNESEGWVHQDDVELSSVAHRVLIDLSERSVVVWEGDDVVIDTTGAIGRPSAPTPTGSYYVRSAFPWDANSVYGPWVLPLSAYSETIDQINGGDAVVAIHGTQRTDLLGSAVSLGCIRLDNDTVTQLASVVPAGTPVEIVP